jgi:hypothetical protein
VQQVIAVELAAGREAIDQREAAIRSRRHRNRYSVVQCYNR